ncbi:hypothetical protein [Pseudomonas sp. 34 E 7]|nr:hypothetical protein [Pseudomonas sp. 34 E 7]
MKRQLCALEALGAATGEVDGQVQRRRFGQLRLPPGQFLGLDRLAAQVQRAAPVAIGLGVDISKHVAIDQGEQLTEQHVERGQVGSDMVDAQQQRMLDTVARLVAQQHQSADLTGSQIEGFVGQLNDTLLHTGGIRVLPDFALQ